MNRLEEIEKDFNTVNPKSNTMNIMKDDGYWLIARVKKLTEVLEYYAKVENYIPNGFYNGIYPRFEIMVDSGSKARKALQHE
jgi:hypothetical protein